MERVQNGGHAERGLGTPSLSVATPVGAVGRGESSDGKEEVSPEKLDYRFLKVVSMIYRIYGLHEVSKAILELIFLIFWQYIVL